MKWSRVALILLLTSCLTPSKQEVTKTLSRVSTELQSIRLNTNLIQEEAPQLEPKTSRILISVTNIEEELPVIDKVVTSMQEELDAPTMFETWLPWVLLVSGLGVAYFGIKTADPWDTPIGLALGFSSVCVSKFYHLFAEVGLWVTIIVVIGMVYYGAKHHALRGTKRLL